MKQVDATNIQKIDNDIEFVFTEYDIINSLNMKKIDQDEWDHYVLVSTCLKEDKYDLQILKYATTYLDNDLWRVEVYMNERIVERSNQLINIIKNKHLKV